MAPQPRRVLPKGQGRRRWEPGAEGRCLPSCCPQRCALCGPPGLLVCAATSIHRSGMRSRRPCPHDDPWGEVLFLEAARGPVVPGLERGGGYVCAEGAPRADSSPISLSLVPRLAWVGAGASGHLQSPGGASGALGGKSHCLRGPCCPVTWGGGHGSLPRFLPGSGEWSVFCVGVSWEGSAGATCGTGSWRPLLAQLVVMGLGQFGSLACGGWGCLAWNAATWAAPPMVLHPTWMRAVLPPLCPVGFPRPVLTASLLWGARCAVVGVSPPAVPQPSPTCCLGAVAHTPRADVSPVAVEAVASARHGPLHPSGTHRGPSLPGWPALPPGPLSPSASSWSIRRVSPTNHQPAQAVPGGGAPLPCPAPPHSPALWGVWPVPGEEGGKGCLEEPGALPEPFPPGPPGPPPPVAPGPALS